MLHPYTKLKFIDNAIGHGVVATRLIPAGTITWVLDDLDMEFTVADLGRMPQLRREYMDTYCYRNNYGNYVLCWDHARFVNHSFDSNCLSTAYDFEIAIRDIRPGEQLTDDYGYLNVEAPFEPVDEGFDRKIVRPDDLLHFHPLWDERLKTVFPKIMQQPQALKEFFDQEQWRTIEQVATGRRAMESILRNYYSPKTNFGF